MIKALAFCAALTCILSGAVHAQTTQPTEPSVEFFTVGDWGVDSPARTQVALAMERREGAVLPSIIDTVLLLGDNFYVKVNDVNDIHFQTFFEQTYSPRLMNVPFYALMGNHDYKDGNDVVELAYAQRGSTRFHMPARYYRIDIPEDHPLATILMLDTNRQAINDADWAAETAWLTAELAKPHAQWLICCGHHNMYGNGNNGDNGVLQTNWGPLFARNHVDFYICGHEHSLQHLEIPNVSTSFVIAGGGGQKTESMLRDKRGPFSRSILGFADFQLTPEMAHVSLIGGDNAVVHEFTRTTAGNIKILKTTPNETPTTHPLRTIVQGD